MQNYANHDDVGITMYVPGSKTATALKNFETVLAQKIKDNEGFLLDSNLNKVVYDAAGITIDKNDITVPELNSVRMGSHVMVNDLDPEMGTHWAIAAVHVPETAVKSTNKEWTYPIGTLANSQRSYTVTLDPESAAYYDANIAFEYYDTMNGIAVSENEKIKINFDVNPNDLTANNYNAFKAANSKVSRLSNLDNGIRYSDNATFNSNHALLSNSLIKRNSGTGELYADGAYQENNALELTVIDANNSDVMFGGLRVVQGSEAVYVTSNVPVSTMTMVNAINGTNDNLPTEFVGDEFGSLFDPVTRRSIGPGYEMNITGSVGGGYSLNFRGFSLDDTALSKNVYYMTQMADFSDVTHEVLISNGNLTRDANSQNFMYRIEGGDEKLDQTQYDKNGVFKTYVRDTSGRTSSILSHSNIPSMRITYDGESGVAGTIPIDSNKLSVYDVMYDVEVLVPSTDAASSYLMADSNTVGKSYNTLAVISNDNVYSNLFNKDSVTYTAASDISNTLEECLNLFQIKQNYEMDQETGAALYSIEGGNMVSNSALTAVTVSNANLGLLHASDIHVKLSPKILSNITQWPSNEYAQWSYSNGSDQALQSQKLTQNDLLSNEDVQTIVNNKMPFKYAIDIDTATRSTSVVGLDYKIVEKVLYGESSVAMLEHTQDKFTVNVVTSATTTRTLDKQYFTLPTGLTAKLILTKSQNYISYKTNLGCYNNLSARTNKFYCLTGEIYLEDSNGNRLPDGHLKRMVNNSGVDVSFTLGNSNYVINYKGNKCFKIISFESITPENLPLLFENVYTSSKMEISQFLMMSYVDLYGFVGMIEKKDVNGNWVNADSNLVDVDVVFDVDSRFIVAEIATVTLDIDIADDSRLPVTNAGQPVPMVDYYIELSNASGTNTYTVSGRKYENNTASIFGGNWQPLSDSPQDFYINTNIGTTLDGLSASVSKTDLSISNPADQNTITLNVYQYNTLLFTFVSNINMAANFNVIYNPAPILKVIETVGIYGQSNYVSTTKYISDISDGTANNKYVQFSPGVEICLKKSAEVGNRATFKLLGDEVECKPYPAYIGVYSSKTEISPIHGFDIGDDNCRHVTLTQYRGIYSTETIALNRSITTIALNIIKNNMYTYSQNLGNLWRGTLANPCAKTVNNLVNLDNSEDIMGSIGLKLNGHLSMFSADTNMSQLISVTYAHYAITVENALDPDYNENKNVYASQMDDENGCIKLFETLKIKASRVKIYTEEKYKIFYGVPDAHVYHYNGNVVDVDLSAIPLSSGNFSLIGSYTDDELRSGIFIKHLKVMRTETNVSSYVENYSLVRPQFKIEAISVESVATVPYVATMVNRRVSYVDINSDVNSYIPFTGYSGINLFELTQLTVDKYTDKRLNPDSSVTSFDILANTIYMKMSIGNVNSNYPNVSEGQNQSYIIYNGEVDKIADSNIEGVFSSTFTSSTGLAKFEFKQPMADMIATDIALRLTNLNILIGGIHIFGVGQGRIFLQAGDSVGFKLYGSRIDRHVNSLNEVSLRHVFVKYETNYGFNFFNEELATHGQILKTIKFPVTAKYEAYVEIDKNDGELTDTPYNLENVLKNANLPSNWTWQPVADFEGRMLQVSLVSVSTHGLNAIQEWLSVDNVTQYKVLLLETPDILSVRSLDGALAMKISYSGAVIAPLMRSYESNYEALVQPFITNDPVDNANSQNMTEEFFAYNITSIAGN